MLAMPPSLTDRTEAAQLQCVQSIQAPLKSLGSETTILVDYPSLSPAWHVAFSVHGDWMAVAFGAPDCCVRIYQCIEEQWICVDTLEGLHTRTVRCVAFAPLYTPHAVVLASASFDGTVAIWEHSNNTNSSNVSDMTQSSGENWECTAQLEGHDNEVKCVVWNSTATLLATCGRDKTVWIWECHLPGQMGASGEAEWECLSVLHGHEGDVKSVSFCSSHQQWGDGDEILLSCGYDGKICIWAEDAGEWYLASTLHDSKASPATTTTIWSMALAPGGVRLVAALADGSIHIYKAYTYEEKQALPDAEGGSNGMWKCVGRLPEAHQGPVYSVAYAPGKAGHGRWASCGTDGALQVYREAMTSTSTAPKFSLEAAATAGSSCEWNQVVWHPSKGSQLVTVGDDGIVRIWKYGP